MFSVYAHVYQKENLKLCLLPFFITMYTAQEFVENIEEVTYSSLQLDTTAWMLRVGAEKPDPVGKSQWYLSWKHWNLYQTFVFLISVIIAIDRIFLQKENNLIQSFNFIFFGDFSLNFSNAEKTIPHTWTQRNLFIAPQTKSVVVVFFQTSLHETNLAVN